MGQAEEGVADAQVTCLALHMFSAFEFVCFYISPFPRRTFQTAQFYFRPSHVFFLGDLFDEGQWCSSQEWDYYVNRLRTHKPKREKILKNIKLGGKSER